MSIDLSEMTEDELVGLARAGKICRWKAVFERENDKKIIDTSDNANPKLRYCHDCNGQKDGANFYSCSYFSIKPTGERK